MATLKYNAKKLELLIPTARRHTQNKFRRDNISIRPSNIDDIVKAIYEDIEVVAAATGITQSLVSLTDTPSAYSGDANRIVGVNSTDDGAEFKNWLISASNLYPGSAGGSIGKSGNGVGKIYFDTTGNLDYEGDLEILTNGTQKAVFKGTSGYLGVGVGNPLEPIHSGGGIVIENATQSSAGTIQYVSGDFQGYDGSSWKSFLSSSSAGCGLTYNTTTNKIDLGGELNNNTAGNNVRLYPSVGSNQVKWGIKLNDAGTSEVMPANADGSNHYYISHFEYWSFVGYRHVIGLFGQGAYGYGSGPQLGCLESQGSTSYLKMYKDVAQMTNSSGHIQGFPGGTTDLLTFHESDSPNDAQRQIWESAGSNTTSITSQTFDKFEWLVYNTAGHFARQRLMSGMADLYIPNADNSKHAMFLTMPSALYWKDGQGLGFTTVPDGTWIGGVATSGSTESRLVIGLGTTDTYFFTGSNSNNRGIKYKGFGETDAETGAGANYSTLVNTSLVPKKYVDDAISSSSVNLATTDLTQAAAGRTYNMNNQNLLFNNGYFKITDAGFGDMFYLEHGGGDITFGGASGVGTGGSNWVHQTNFNVASSTVWDHKDFGGNIGLRIANWTTTGGLNSYGTIEYKGTGSLYVLQNGGGAIQMGSSTTINIGYGSGTTRPETVKLLSGAGRFQISGINAGVGSTTFRDDTATKAGIEYEADYSADYSSRSLIDKGYADSTYLNGISSSTDNAIVRWDGTAGDTIQNSGVLVDDSNNITGVNKIAVASRIEHTGVAANHYIEFGSFKTELWVGGNWIINFGSSTTTFNPGGGFSNDIDFRLNDSAGLNYANFDAGESCLYVGTGVRGGTGYLRLAQPTTSSAQVNWYFNNGADPSSPNDGDMWYNGTNLYFYDGSSSVDLLASGSGSGTTNLSEGTTTNTTVDVNSSTGTNATLASASTTRAGLMSKAKFDEVVANTAKVGLTAGQITILNNTSGTNTGDQTDSEIETAYNNQVAEVTQAEAEAGTLTDVKRWTPQRVKQAIDALSSGGNTIYTADDTLTGNRTVTQNGNNLNFDTGNGLFKVDDTASIGKISIASIDRAIFSHKDYANISQYALHHSSTGFTLLNTFTGKEIQFTKEHNTVYGKMTDAGKWILGGGSFVGTEKILLDGKAFIKGEGTSFSTVNFALYNDDTTPALLLDSRDNGQIGFGGVAVSSNAYTFRNPAGKATIARFDHDGSNTPSFTVGQSGSLLSAQSGSAVFYSYRQSGISYIKLFDAGTENVRLAKTGSLINSSLVVGGTTLTAGARFEVQQASTNVAQQLFFANARTSTAGRLGSDTGFGSTQAGFECYDTDLNKKFFWNGTGWEKIKGNIESVSVASSSAITPNVDNSEMEIVNALAAGLTINAPTGTAVEGQNLVFRLKDDGSARTLTWNAIFRAIGVTLPTTTTASKLLYVGCKYNLVDTKWDVVSVQEEA